MLPEDFYLAAILNKKVEEPCRVNDTGLCKDYTYLNVTQFPITFGTGGYIQEQNKIDRVKEYYQGTQVIDFL